MKKLVFMFVAFAAISFASCGGNTNANAEGGDSTATVDSAATVEDSAATNDSLTTDSAATTADSAATEVAPEA